MAFKFEGKEMYPFSVVGQFIPKWLGLARTRTAIREKYHFRTNSAVSCQVYVHALLVQHLQSVYNFFSFISLKNVQLTVQVCCLFYFLLHSKFFKGKVRSGIFGGFYCFFKCFFFKRIGVLLVASNYINTEE